MLTMLESLNYSFRNPKKHNLSNLPHQIVEKLQKKKQVALIMLIIALQFDVSTSFNMQWENENKNKIALPLLAFIARRLVGGVCWAAMLLFIPQLPWLRTTTSGAVDSRWRHVFSGWLPIPTKYKTLTRQKHGVLRGPQLDKQRGRARLGILRVNH